MEFVSILDLKAVPEREGGRPIFFLDLNLNQIIDRICALWERNVSSYYYYLPANGACEDYRREVFADIKQEETYGILCRFVKRMQERQEACTKGAAVWNELQKEVWFISEAAVYCEAFMQLHEELHEVQLTSRGMRAFRAYLGNYLGSSAFQSLQKAVAHLREEMNGFRLTFTYENERISVEIKRPAGEEEKTSGVGEGSYDSFLKNAFPEQNRKMKSPFEISMQISELEQEIVKILRKLQPDFFKETKKFYSDFSKYPDEVLLRFAEEIEFYLSFRCFEKHMGDRGHEFAAPERCEAGEMKAYGLYDLALACAGRGRVISNDMSYLSGEKFFVLTGPNQGGKTTFARSLGQLVYFTKMGLDVPAKAATVPYFGEILTHFSVEESVETGRGKLKEELVRLEPMMDATYENAFVIINELFTTAANYDACIMGKRVLQHFLAQGCWGIYVTHLKELAQEEPGIVSLRAMLDGNGRQNFEILRSPAVESASAINQVNKYRLTYQQLKERLS